MPKPFGVTATSRTCAWAIFASIHHCYSTDDWPQHQFCPEGEESWCFYKRAIAMKESCWDHITRVHNYLDYERLHKHLAPIYDRLTDQKLLQRCKLHLTQNANESFHQSVWARCSKTKFHSLESVKFAVFLAAAEFNFGSEYAASVDALYGVTSGVHSARLREQRESKRLTKSITKPQMSNLTHKF